MQKYKPQNRKNPVHKKEVTAPTYAPIRKFNTTIGDTTYIVSSYQKNVKNVSVSNESNILERLKRLIEMEAFNQAQTTD